MSAFKHFFLMFPGPEAAVLELKLKALILDTIHNMDVVQYLMATGAKAVTDWMWQKQLR
jgi:dynein heavy chain 2